MTFGDRVITAIALVPRGKVASYGQIAAIAGSPRAALMVGKILRTSSTELDLPWQRIINSRGLISIMNINHPAQQQAELLKSEGVIVERRDQDYWVDLKKFGWEPDKIA